MAPQIHPIDRHVGEQVRAIRQGLGLSQEALGKHIGVSFQQIQKYERGVNRLSSSKLWEISELMKTPIHRFFPVFTTMKPRDPAEQVYEVRLNQIAESVKEPHHRQLLIEMAQKVAAMEQVKGEVQHDSHE